MEDVRCPHCKVVLLPVEVRKGRCEACGKQLSSVSAEDSEKNPSPPAYQNRDTRPTPESLLGSPASQCSLCGGRDDCQACWLRVIRVFYIVVFARVRRFYVQCNCCRDCRRKMASLKSFRRKCVIAMILAMPIGGAIYFPFFAAIKHPTSLQRALAITILLGSLGIFFLMPVFMAIGGKSRMKKILSSEVDEQLRRATGVKWWGLSNFVIVKDAKGDGMQVRM